MRLGLTGGDKEEEGPDWIGSADTNEMMRAKTSATRPAREWIFEYCMIIVGPADEKMERARTPDPYRLCSQKAVLHVTRHCNKTKY